MITDIRIESGRAVYDLLRPESKVKADRRKTAYSVVLGWGLSPGRGGWRHRLSPYFGVAGQEGATGAQVHEIALVIAAYDKPHAGRAVRRGLENSIRIWMNPPRLAVLTRVVMRAKGLPSSFANATSPVETLPTRSDPHVGCPSPQAGRSRDRCPPV